MAKRNLLGKWPAVRQLTEGDLLGLKGSAQSELSQSTKARLADADRVTSSICPYCAVGCGQSVYSRGDQVIQIEGDYASPLSRGRLCPKGAASKELVTSPLRELKVKYRRPYSTGWEELPLEQAMDMIADRVVATRAETWEAGEPGRPLNRTMGIASLGGATLDNEENYLWRKLTVGLGIVQVENQARI